MVVGPMFVVSTHTADRSGGVDCTTNYLGSQDLEVGDPHLGPRLKQRDFLSYAHC